MPIDTTQPGSPGWWLTRLAGELADRRPDLERLWRYYQGEPDLPEGSEDCRDAYKAFQRKARTNYARLIVKAVRDRMVVTGFRTGADDDANGDKEARAIWNANRLRVDAGDLHTFLTVMGSAYTIVGGPSDESAGKPLVTVEDPRQVIAATHPATGRRTLAALKQFVDDVNGHEVAYVYMPGRRFVAFRSLEDAKGAKAGEHWEWDANAGGADGEALPYDVVPVVEFRNEDRMGEFEPHLDLIDRINKTILDRMVITAIQAFRQRALVGELPEKDAEGNDIDYGDMFKPGPGALWTLPPGVDIKELGQADLTPILTAVKDDVRDLAAVSQTPLYFISPDAANGSAQGASTMRESLVFKVEDRIARASEGWAQTMALAFLFAGDETRAQLLEMVPMWQPAERFSLMEKSQAAAQAQDLPFRTRATEIWQFAPDKVDEMETERAGDMLLSFEGVPDGDAA